MSASVTVNVAMVSAREGTLNVACTGFDVGKRNHEEPVEG
jgi:hypothetical protein